MDSSFNLMKEYLYSILNDFNRILIVINRYEKYKYFSKIVNFSASFKQKITFKKYKIKNHETTVL